MKAIARLTSLLLLLGVHPASAGPFYVVKILGTLGGDRGGAIAINNAGQIVGESANVSGEQRAFVFENGALFDLGTLGGGSSIAKAINARGDIVGAAQLANRTYRATIFKRGAPNVEIDGFEDINGKNNSSAQGINGSGQIVGYGVIDPIIGTQRAFIRTGGDLTVLGTLGGSTSYLYAITEDGVAVGGARTNGNAAFNAFRLVQGLMFNQGALQGDTFAEYLAINSAGEAVGYSGSTAILYSQGIMRNLGTLGGIYSQANAINADGEIVGEIEGPPRKFRPFLYRNGSMKDLNTMCAPPAGMVLSRASGINDLGQIVGYATNSQGKTRPFLLTLDTKPPVVKPKGSGKRTVNSARVVVKGIANDDSVVRKVEFRVGKRAFRTAKGMGKWSFSTALKPGKNKIQIRAIDGAGLKRTANLTIIRS